MNRSRFFGLSQVKRLADNLRDRVSIGDGGRPLDDRAEHRHNVHRLVGFLVQPQGRSLTRQSNQGGPVHVGVSHPGQQVCCTRTQRAQTHPRFSRQTSIDIRNKRRALFMPAHNEFN